MESAHEFNWTRGLPGMWKVEEGETPVQALERFYTAMDQKLPERDQELIPFQAIHSKIKKARAELGALERDYRGEGWEEQHAILRKRSQLIKLENREIAAVQLLTKKYVLLAFWKFSGGLDRNDVINIDHKLSGGMSHKEQYEELKILKGNVDVAKELTLENPMLMEQCEREAIDRIERAEERARSWIAEWQVEVSEDTRNFAFLFCFFLWSGRL